MKALVDSQQPERARKMAVDDITTIATWAATCYVAAHDPATTDDFDIHDGAKSPVVRLVNSGTSEDQEARNYMLEIRAPAHANLSEVLEKVCEGFPCVP